jgi:hypothetical protein
MAAISSKVEFSFTQASLINLGGIVGTIVAGGLLLITQPDDGQVIMATLMAGGVLGLAGGYGIFGRNVAGLSDGLTLREPYWVANGKQYGNGSREAQASLLSVRF